MHAPTTLREKLSTTPDEKQHSSLTSHSQIQSLLGIKSVLSLGMFGLVTLLFFAPPNLNIYVIFGLWGMVFVVWIYAKWFANNSKSPRRIAGDKIHSLLAHGRQGFMGDLRLADKTVIFDGSNIYHFGHDIGLDAQPLGLLANQLRTEGYRIVCFFDANIFYTLQEHGAFDARTRHSVELLIDIFGLRPNEIYVVPSGVQADRYVLSAIKHLPISFAVTNDQFRDYQKQYKDVMKGQWRKGIKISKNEIKLLQHKLETPIRIG